MVENKMKKIRVKYSLVFIPFIVLMLGVFSSFNISAQNQNIKSVLDEKSSYSEIIKIFSEKSFKTKIAAIDRLVDFGDPRTVGILSQIQQGKLYYIKSSKEMVYKTDTPDGDIEAFGILSKVSLGVMGSRKIKKVRINNKLRKKLRQVIAGLELGSEDKNLRLAAAKNLIKNRSEEFRPAIEKAIGEESDALVLEALKVSLAVIDIKNADQIKRLNAVSILEDSLEPEVIALLVELVTPDEEGQYIETSEAVLKEANRVLSASQTKVAYFKAVENVFFGISLGSVLLLAAVGLAITFGVMGVINMAHGEMMMLGAYTTYVIQQMMPDHIGASILVAIPAAFIVSGIVGIIIERGVIRHLYGRPLETLLATFGISLILQQLVRSIFSPLNRSVKTPDWMSGSMEINGALSLTYNRLYIIIFSILVLLALILLLKKTYFGLQMRAVTQNRSMANSMGIRSNWIDALTFGLGSGIAGMAGVALSQLTNVGPNLGQNYIVDCFMVVVFGGVGNLFGTFFAAMSLGLVNKLAEPYAGAVLAKIIILVFIILFIQRRPRGLFAIKGRAVED